MMNGSRLRGSGRRRCHWTWVRGFSPTILVDLDYLIFRWRCEPKALHDRLWWSLWGSRCSSIGQVLLSPEKKEPLKKYDTDGPPRFVTYKTSACDTCIGGSVSVSVREGGGGWCPQRRGEGDVGGGTGTAGGSCWWWLDQEPAQGCWWLQRGGGMHTYLVCH